MNSVKVKLFIWKIVLALCTVITMFGINGQTSYASTYEINGQSVTIPGTGWYQLLTEGGTPLNLGSTTTIGYYNPTGKTLALEGGKVQALRAIFASHAPYYNNGTELVALPLNDILNVYVANDVVLGTQALAGQTKDGLFPKLTTVYLTEGAQIDGSAVFANNPSLQMVDGIAALPADSHSMFQNTPKLFKIRMGNTVGAAVTNAKNFLYNSGSEANDNLTVNLSTYNHITDDTNMLYYTPKIKYIYFGTKPSTASGWTGRWAYDATGNKAIESAEETKLAKDWIAGDMALTNAYILLNTDDEYTTVGLATSIYKCTELNVDNTYLLAAPNKKFTAYCLEYGKNVPHGDYYTQTSIATAGFDWENHLDPIGTMTDRNGNTLTVTRTLTQYDNNVQKALETILFYGFPNNGGNLTEGITGLTDADYYAATQALIWNVLSNVPQSTGLTMAKSNTSASNEMYARLALKTYANFEAEKGTGEIDLALYTPDNGLAQNMVSGGYSVTITKYDITGTNELAGAVLKVSSDATGTNVIDTWTSVAHTSHRITGLIPGQTYYLTETTAPAGYAIAEQISFVAGGNNQQVKMYDDYATHTITVNKVDDSNPANKVAGAELTLSGTDYTGAAITNKVVTTTQTAPVTFTNLLPGTYKITETKTPEGYETAEAITVNITMTDPSEDSTNYTYNMIDKVIPPISASISKYDITGTKEIAGAVLTVSTDKEQKNVIDTWTSVADTPHIVKGLTKGQTYYLTEVTAPAGYNIAEQIAFVAETDNQKVKMYDAYAPHTITVNKVDDSNPANRVIGATLTLTGTDYTGKAVTTQTVNTTNAAVTFTGLLPGTYTITETKTPAKYRTADAIKVTINVTNPADDAKNYTVNMVDKAIQYGNVSVSKVDPKGAFLSGATFAITNPSGENVATFTTGNAATTISDLEVGVTYTLTETSAPAGYEKAEKQTFTVTNGGTTSVKITDEYSKHEIIIKKVDDSNNRVANAELKISGTLTSGKTFEDFTFTTSADKDYTAWLEPGNYTITETKTPSGYKTANSQNFTVALNDNTKTLTIVDKKETATETKTQTQTNNTTTPTNTAATKTTQTNGTVAAAQAPKTGDEAPIGLLFIIIGVSLVALAGGTIFIIKKKNKSL